MPELTHRGGNIYQIKMTPVCGSRKVPDWRFLIVDEDRQLLTLAHPLPDGRGFESLSIMIHCAGDQVAGSCELGNGELFSCALSFSESENGSVGTLSWSWPELDVKHSAPAEDDTQVLVVVEEGDPGIKQKTPPLIYKL